MTKEGSGRIIFALDGIGGKGDVGEWVHRLSPVVKRFKVGKELYTRQGPDVVRVITDFGARVFLDLKFHDIPETVNRAVRAAGDLGVEIVNIHAFGGREMMQAAREAADEVRRSDPGREFKVVAVTLLTSLGQEDIRELGIGMTVENLVGHLSKTAREAGLDGVVASPWEAERIRKEAGRDFLIITPGIRTVSGSQDDQKRVSTPEEAINAGADLIVVGRDVRRAEDPAAKCKEIEEKIAVSLAKRGSNR